MSARWRCSALTKAWYCPCASGGWRPQPAPRHQRLGTAKKGNGGTSDGQILPTITTTLVERVSESERKRERAPLLAYFVGAPTGKVHPPIVQLQLSVPHCMSTVKAHVTALRGSQSLNSSINAIVFQSYKRPPILLSHHLLFGSSGDGSHVEQLTSIVLDTAQHNHSNRITLLLDDPQDILRP